MSLFVSTALACGSSPSFEPSAARAAVERAAERLRPALPDDARNLERLLAEAEAVTVAERRAPAWRRRSGAVAAAWAPALVSASRALSRLERLEREAAFRWAVLEGVAVARLERARSRAETPGIGRRDAQGNVERAAIQLVRARREAAAGRLDRAIVAAEAAAAWAGRVDERWRALYARFEQPELRRQWRAWIDDAVAASRSGSSALVVDKLGRRLDVYSGGRLVASFSAELGTGGLRRKLHAGDRATPEGRYRVVQVKVAAATRYYKALLIDYPSRDDRARFDAARKRAVISKDVGIGGLIEIHGHGGRGEDWTDGCVALADDDMDRLFRHVGVGTPVIIVGTDGGNSDGR